MKLLGWRKTAYWTVTLLAMSLGAWLMHGSFTEYRDGLVALAALVLAAHVTQQKLSPITKDDPPPAGAK